MQLELSATKIALVKGVLISVMFSAVCLATAQSPLKVTFVLQGDLQLFSVVVLKGLCGTEAHARNRAEKGVPCTTVLGCFLLFRSTKLNIHKHRNSCQKE